MLPESENWHIWAFVSMARTKSTEKLLSCVSHFVTIPFIVLTFAITVIIKSLSFTHSFSHSFSQPFLSMFVRVFYSSFAVIFYTSTLLDHFLNISISIYVYKYTRRQLFHLSSTKCEWFSSHAFHFTWLAFIDYVPCTRRILRIRFKYWSLFL